MKAPTYAALLLTLAVSLAACSDHTSTINTAPTETTGEEAETHLPAQSEKIILLVQPEDLATDMSSTPVRLILVPSADQLVTQELLQDVLKRLTLQANSGPIAIKTSLEIDNTLETGISFTNPSAVAISPVDSNWPNEWLELRITSLPANVVARQLPSTTDLPVRVRFYPGSRPTPQTAETCAKGDGTQVVVIRFSEPVDAAVLSTHLIIESNGEPCSLTSDHASFVRNAHYSCGRKPPDSPIRIVMRPGIKSESEVAVTMLDGSKELAVLLAVERAVETDPGCFKWTLN